ncbi:hypothetical protein NLI96_g9153 [Meripilus lineatus]|uniref:Uncharacterized protein n=1 Tax=Meripilus lineatus TaxID=2056292 RepID=A0AAD5V0P5_9APHY|nr:hypothetical protein NLI96_g9153 [Physisporinus lineatus]
MGQHWNIIDIDKRLQIKFLGKIIEFFFWRYEARLFSAITQPPIKETPIMVPYVRGTTGLLKLPQELILEIVPCIDDFIDAVALVMTNKMLYSLGFELIQRRMVRMSAPSIGSKILCLGDGIAWGRSDLPPGVTARDWENAMEGAERNEEYFNNYYELTSNTFYELEGGNLRIPFLSAVLAGWGEKGMWYRGSSNQDPWHKALTAMLTLGDARNCGRNDDQLVLCNLTKRVYVDAGKAWELIKTSFLRTDDGIPYLLEIILQCHICWSSDPDMSFSYEGELHRGAWAADRFEITTRDKFMTIKPFPGGAQDDWKDVTEPAMEITNNFAIAYDVFLTSARNF